MNNNITFSSDFKKFTKLPLELKNYVYKYLHNDAKVYYWLYKYKWNEILFEIFKCYSETYIVEKFYELCPCGNKELLYDHFQYIIDKCYNSEGQRVKIHFWEFSPENEYNNLHDDLAMTIEKYVIENSNKRGIYKFMAECVYLYNSRNILCQIDDIDYL